MLVKNASGLRNPPFPAKARLCIFEKYDGAKIFSTKIKSYDVDRFMVDDCCSAGPACDSSLKIGSVSIPCLILATEKLVTGVYT
jgi:hypothetical protein